MAQLIINLDIRATLNSNIFVCHFYDSNNVLLSFFQQGQSFTTSSNTGIQQLQYILPDGNYSFNDLRIKITNDNVFTIIEVPSFSIDCTVETTTINTTTLPGTTTTTTQNCPTMVITNRNGVELTISTNSPNSTMSAVGIGSNVNLPFIYNIPNDRFNRNEPTTYNFTISKPGCPDIFGSYTLPANTPIGNTTTSTTTVGTTTTENPNNGTTTTTISSELTLDAFLGPPNVYNGVLRVGYQSNTDFLNVVLDTVNSSVANGARFIDTATPSLPSGKTQFYYVDGVGPYPNLNGHQPKKYGVPVFIKKIFTNANPDFERFYESSMNGNHAESSITVY